MKNTHKNTTKTTAKGTNKNTTKPRKYTPKTKEELQNLARDEGIYLGDIDTSHITDMRMLFWGSERKDFSGIERWDVSNVRDMSGMFFRAESFSHPLESWDVSRVENMSRMFAVAESFNQPLSSWDVSSVRDMSEMFYAARSFSQNLDSWQVKEGADIRGAFKHSGMSALPKWLESLTPKKGANGKYTPLSRVELEFLIYDESISLGDIDTKYITDMSGLFHKINRRDFRGIESLDVSNVERMGSMFNDASSFNQPLGAWDVGKVETMIVMFNGAAAFDQNLDSWQVKEGVNVEKMFENSGMKQLPKWLKSSKK
ncbi:hypothetical protein BKN38_02340 [Helicobacter sp. CLO-3]|nr:hypothetical protein BA723_00690 [Helicobacter sp. CLO-3]OHU84703.1 hypothetical protein BKN38_02340 [Helicobacter sp. CLO-3]